MVDMVPEARKWYALAYDNIGEETKTMKMVRHMADDIEGWEKVFEKFGASVLRVNELYRAAHPGESPRRLDGGKMIAWLCDEFLETRRELEKMTDMAVFVSQDSGIDYLDERIKMARQRLAAIPEKLPTEG